MNKSIGGGDRVIRMIIFHQFSLEKHFLVIFSVKCGLYDEARKVDKKWKVRFRKPECPNEEETTALASKNAEENR